MATRDVLIKKATRIQTPEFPREIVLAVPGPVRKSLEFLVEYQEQTRKTPAPVYTVSIKPPFTPRTTGKKSQNARINASIQNIAHDTGNDFDDIKLYCKSRAVSMGYPYQQKPDGTPVLCVTSGMIAGISESEASMDDARILIDAINMVAAELNVILREGDDWS